MYGYIINYIIYFTYNYYILIDRFFSLLGLYAKPYLFTAVFKKKKISIYSVLSNPNHFLYFGLVLIGLVLLD